MAETTMPAAEAEVVVAEESNSYELAFHVLPTVAEGEVSGVFDAIKALITKNGGEVFDSEAPERFDLAYEIVKHMEGKNRRFTSAYFGWIRFTVAPEAIASITEGVEADANILRHLLIKLTKAEEANPFRFHEALASQKVVTDVDAVPATDSATVEGDSETSSEEETSDDVSENEENSEEKDA